MLKLSNTLTKSKEEFKSLEPKKVGMYSCGPTVYDYPHIGNLRKYVFDDVLRRTLEFLGYEVKQVMNITDFGHLSSDADEGEDKMTKGLKREGKPLTLESMKELGDFYTNKFKEDLTALNIESPAAMPKASEHIKEDIDLISVLDKKGFVYKTSDGLYFDTSKLKDYGRLGGITESKESETRIGVNSEKKNSKDFALWKFNPELGFESPWGTGFPGWHIECSAMAMKYLGEQFDIHTGGIDHIPVHHNNEIAQSEAATGKVLANYWVHENFLNIGDTKISKSLKNFFILKDITDRNINPLAYRYWLLTAHYQSPVNFTWEALEAAQTTYDRLIENYLNLENGGKVDQEYMKKFTQIIENDIDTPRAVALMWEMRGDSNLDSGTKKATLLAFDEVFGLDLKNSKEVVIPESVATLVKEREVARQNKDWKKADEMRAEILKRGFDIKDIEGGCKLYPSKSTR